MMTDLEKSMMLHILNSQLKIEKAVVDSLDASSSTSSLISYKVSFAKIAEIKRQLSDLYGYTVH